MYKPQEKTDLSLMRSVNDILQSPANLCRWNLQGKTVYTLCKKVEPYNMSYQLTLQLQLLRPPKGVRHTRERQETTQTNKTTPSQCVLKKDRLHKRTT